MVDLETRLQEIEAMELLDDSDVETEKQRQGELARRKAELKFNAKKNQEWRAKHESRKAELAERWKALGERRQARNEFYHALILQMSGTSSNQEPEPPGDEEEN